MVIFLLKLNIRFTRFFIYTKQVAAKSMSLVNIMNKTSLHQRLCLLKKLFISSKNFDMLHIAEEIKNKICGTNVFKKKSNYNSLTNLI